MDNKIYLVRHGQTDWNFQNLFQGKTDIPLNDRGRQQARETGKALSGVKFDVVYCSPLSRARETCGIILESNKFGASPVFDDRTRERSFGVLEGTSVDDVLKRNSGGWWHLHKPLVVEGMETTDEVFKRVHGFLDEIKRVHKNKSILVVCHGGVMRAAYFYFNSLPEDGDLFKAYKAENASVDKYDL